MNKKINTVLFDLDGTLLNTLTDLTNSVNHVMEYFGYPSYTQDKVRRMVGNGIGVLLERALPQGRANPRFEEGLQTFQVHYSAHMQDETGPFPGITELLKALNQEGYLMAVVSNKFDSAVKALCREYFGGCILSAIGESALVARKPAPDTVFTAMKELGSAPDSCIYVGDSEVDIATAENAGIPCISVCWGFKDEAFLRAHGAAHIVSDAGELHRMITDWPDA